MHYFRNFTRSSSERIQALVDANWALMRDWIHLIASACYPFPQVLDALCHPMFVFPVEGLPGERYFPGTHVMDNVEERSEAILRRLFDADGYRATIQPHSGTQANQVVFNAVLKTGDSVLSLSPAEGGHISHTVLVGRRNPVIYYPLSLDGRIDFSHLDDLAARNKPKLIIVGGSAIPREIDYQAAGAIARKHGALLHADISHTATFVAARMHAGVTPHADFVTFNMVKNLRGPAGGVLIYRKDHQKAVRRGLFPDTQGGPNENVLFAKYVALELLDQPYLQTYARQIVSLARTMARVFSDHDIDVLTGGTDSHLILLDLRNRRKTGLEIERLCERHRILLNRNLVPGDPERPEVGSGIRLGTACLAILNYSDSDAARLAQCIAGLIGGDEMDPMPLVRELTERYNTILTESGQ